MEDRYLADQDGKSDTGHGHVVADVEGLLSALDGKADGDHTHGWGEVTGKPSEFPPATHTHTPSEVGLSEVDNTADADKPVSGPQQAAIDAKVQLVAEFPSSPESGVLYLRAE